MFAGAPCEIRGGKRSMEAVFCGSADVAVMLGCSTRWVRQLTDSGRIPAGRMRNGKRIYRIADIEEYLGEAGADGLRRLAESERALAARETEVIDRFITECCHVGPQSKALATPLFERFQQWGGDLIQRDFATRLAERGFKSVLVKRGRNTGRKVWVGIGLVTEETRA